jgi:hypothetical protein
VLKFVLIATLALATSAAAQPSLERGDYLVNAVMACDGCHTPRGPTGFVMEKRFSGGSQTWDDPAYTVKGSNITPDPDPGIWKVERKRHQDIANRRTAASRYAARATDAVCLLQDHDGPRSRLGRGLSALGSSSEKSSSAPCLSGYDQGRSYSGCRQTSRRERFAKSYSTRVLSCHSRPLHGVPLAPSRWPTGFFELVW